MNWQLPDIGKTLTNNILPNSLRASQYVSGDTVILSIGGSRSFPVFPYRVALFPWIRIGLYIKLNSTAGTTWSTF